MRALANHRLFMNFRGDGVKGLEANARRQIVGAPAQSRAKTWAGPVVALDGEPAGEPFQ